MRLRGFDVWEDRVGVLTACLPRPEVLEGDLNDAIFAADFGDVVSGSNAPDVYRNPRLFFQNTYPTAQLRKVVTAVFGRLADATEVGTSVRLSTGFGGGKTHTLLSLWHLARNIGQTQVLGTELLPAAGRPHAVTVVAVDAGKAGHPIFAHHGDITVRSLWGEVAYQLGLASGESTANLARLGAADDADNQPDEETFAAMFPDGPVLILLDELVIYLGSVSQRGQGNILAFINKLASIAAKRPQTVLVVTDPSAQRAYEREASQMQDALAGAARLDDMLGRRVSDYDPIGDEAAQVVVRRLFANVNEHSAQQASAAYHDLYKRVAQDLPGTLPSSAVSADYAKRILQCYPFHPRLLDSTQDRLGALQEFNKSRGTLRLFARIIRTVWEEQRDLDLITAGDIDWNSQRIQADLLSRLNRDNFKAAVSADVVAHAGELDAGALRGVHRRAASALLLESIPMQTNSGLTAPELSLAILRPDEAGSEPADALNRLVGVCWHTYPMGGGSGWQFRYEPNIVKQIEQRSADMAAEDVRSRIRLEAQGYFNGPTFRLVSWPASPKQVPERAELQLALCENEAVAKQVCQYSDTSNPDAPMPRVFRNAIVAVTASEAAWATVTTRGRRVLAAESLREEYKHGDANRMVREQLAKVLPDLARQFRLQTRRAFDRVALATGEISAIEEKYQVSDDQILAEPRGQAGLLRYLQDKHLLYADTDALDVHRFMTAVVPGTTPTDTPDVYTARAIHERFLAAPGLRLVRTSETVRNTLRAAVAAGEIVVRLRDGSTFDANGCVEGGPNDRHRSANRTLAQFTLDDDTLIALVAASIALEWLAETASSGVTVGDGAGDVSGGGGWNIPPPPPPPTSQREATTWQSAREHAATRPLRALTLRARTPAAAATLAGLAQPLGAESLALSVSVGGQLKSGGTVNFAATDVTPNHPTKPLDTARILFTAMNDGTGTYEATLTLQFGDEGRVGLAEALTAAEAAATDSVGLRAVFGREGGAS